MNFYYKNTKDGIRVFGDNGVDYTFNTQFPFYFRVKTNGFNNKWSRLSDEDFERLSAMLKDSKAIKRFIKLGK